MDGKADSLLKRARELYEKGLFAEAGELLSGGGGDDPNVLAFRAYLLYRQGKNDAAAEVYELLAGMQPDNPSHLSNLGLIHLKEGRFEEAREAFEGVLALQPDDARALRNLDHCHRRLGDGRRAEELPRRGGQRGGGPLEGVAGGLTDRGRARGGGAPAETPARQRAEFERLAGAACLPPPESGPEVVRPGPGGVFLRIDEKTFVNPRYLSSYRGVVVFAEAPERGGRPPGLFARGQSAMLRVEGKGELGLSGRGSELMLHHLGGAGLYVNYPSLVLCGAEVTVDHQGARAGNEAFRPALLRGEGRVVIAARGAVSVVEVLEDLPLTVRPEAVVAWSVPLEFESGGGPMEGGLLRRRSAERYLRFEGAGCLLLQGLPGD